MIKYPSIDSLRGTLNTFKNHYAFQGLDDDGNAIYSYNQPLPVLKLYGTVKVHGTNAGLSYDGKVLTIQSRKNVLATVDYTATDP
jgi:hypothetical protein